MATKSYRAEIEKQIPQLRQCARALVGPEFGDMADDLVHDALTHALKTERTWLGEHVGLRLFGRLVAANRARLRMEQGERRSGVPTQAGSPAAAQQMAGPAMGGGGHGSGAGPLAALPLDEREVLALVVLGGLDYPTVSQALGLPVATVVSRLTQARARIGTTLWRGPRVVADAARSARPAPVRSASHLRLVKS